MTTPAGRFLAGVAGVGLLMIYSHLTYSLPFWHEVLASWAAYGGYACVYWAVWWRKAL